MLFTTTVHPATLELLKQLMELSELHEFALAGGTALALYKGHRVSIDLDFFSSAEFDSRTLYEQLRYSLPFFLIEQLGIARNTLNLSINTVKTDILRFDYPLIEPIQIIDGVRLFSVPDIAAMKLSALAGRGAKKDFYDVDCLLQDFSLRELLEFFTKKFHVDPFHVIKSLTYFDDADNEPEPMLLTKISWSEIKQRIRNISGTL